MAYQPVQRNAGEIMYNAAMRRAQTLGGALENWSNTLYQRQQQQEALAQAKAEEDKAFNSKLKALEALLQSHKDKFKLDEAQLKQFLSTDPNESPKNRYGRIAGFVEGTMKAAELEKTQAEARKLGAPPPMEGQPMTMQQIEDLRGRGYDVNAVPTSNPNIVMVKGLSPRAPAAPVAPTVVPSTGATLINPVTGQREIVPALPDIPTGYEMVPPTAAAAPTPAPAPTATTPPPGLSRFAAAASAPSGGPMAALGQFAPPPQAAARPAAAPAPAGTRMAVRPLEGSPQAAQLAEAAASRAAATTRRIESADAAIQSLDKVLERVSPLSVGVGSLLKGIPSTEAANINALLKNVQASTAFNELKDLKEDKTTLGQVAVKEIELLQNAATALDMSMSPELFKEQALQLKARFETTKRRLMLLDEERRQGRTAPSDAYYQAGGLPLDALNKLSTAPTAGEDPTAALRAQGWTVKKK
jgi:hypothetical protein